MDYFFSKILDEFALHLRLKGRSEKTVQAYCGHLKQFVLDLKIPPRQVSEFVLKNYVCELFNRYKTNTVCVKIWAIKRFYGFLYETGKIISDPSSDLIGPERTARIPANVLSSSEMETIINYSKENTSFNRRDRALIEVLYSTGMRLFELAGLDIADVDLTAKIIRIRSGKGGKDRQAVLSRAACDVLADYLEKRRTSPCDPHALWINRRGKRLSGYWIWKVIKSAAENADVKSTANPHAWRHGVATSLLLRGASVREVQVFLGHSSVKTTQIYTHLTIRDLKKTHKQTHPREKDPIPRNIEPLFSLPVRQSLDEVGDCI